MKNFVDLMEELGDLLDTELIPDLNQVCLIVINESINVQLEMDVTGEFILMACEIIELPPGRFREDVLKESLKINYFADLRPGILSYIGNENALVLFQNILAHGLTAEELHEHLSVFAARCENWKKAISDGKTCPDEEKVKSAKGRGSIF